MDTGNILLIHADYTRRATVVPGQHRWLASPQGGVDRVMLDRLGGERARATSLVRYAPGAHFPVHQHPGGEEILVLSGTFSADGEQYPAGSYLRNPPGSSHHPSSSDGAVLFVKLWQMTDDEQAALRIDTRDSTHWQDQGDRDICPLFSNKNEQVSLQHLAPDRREFLRPFGAYLLGMRDRLRGAAAVIVIGGGECRLGQGHLKGHVTRPAGSV